MLRLGYRRRKVAHMPTITMLPESQPRQGFVEQADFDAILSDWQMHDGIFNNQRRLTPELLVELATRLQLDTDEMATAIDVQRYLDRITRDVEGGERAGVHSTPTFFINGQLYSGAWDFENLLQALDAA